VEGKRVRKTVSREKEQTNEQDEISLVSIGDQGLYHNLSPVKLKVNVKVAKDNSTTETISQMRAKQSLNLNKQDKHDQYVLPMPSPLKEEEEMFKSPLPDGKSPLYTRRQQAMQFTLKLQVPEKEKARNKKQEQKLKSKQVEPD
jgi:hypothetical protein